MGDRYYRVWNGKTGNAWMAKPEELDDLKGKEAYFISTSYYSEAQAQEFKKTHSVAGVHNVKTDQLWFDFDSTDLLDSQHDAVMLYNNLLGASFDPMSIRIYFSGNKGFHVIVDLQDPITPYQVKKITEKLAGTLKTWDRKIYDASRILRAPNTKHEKTGLYKVELEHDELQLPIKFIQELARGTRDLEMELHQAAKLPEHLLLPPEPVKTKVEINPDDPLRIRGIDFSQKPHGWKDYKWSLAQGRFEIGKRNHAMMVIASTCRALKYGREHTEAVCLAADKLHCGITGDSYINEVDLDRQVLDVVFSERWNGGSYSAETDSELKDYCAKHGFDLSKPDGKTVDVREAFNVFKNFKKNAGKFVVSTGIPSLDKAAKMTIGQVIGIVAGPAVGKSSLALQLINNMSKTSKARSIFFSYDMYISLVMQKLMQKHTDWSEDQIDQVMQNLDPKNEREMLAVLQEEYGNVSICFEGGQSVDDIRTTLKQEREKHREVNLIVIDYNELISSNNSDSTESSKEVAQKLRSLANNENVCVVVLMQPSKITGGPSEEIKSYRAIKGSSMSEQSLDLALGLSRPGFDPENPDDDRFLIINCLKNRFGKLFRLELLFDGYSSTFSEIKSDSDRLKLQEVRQRRNEEKRGQTGFGDFRGGGV